MRRLDHQVAAEAVLEVWGQERFHGDILAWAPRASFPRDVPPSWYATGP